MGPHPFPMIVRDFQCVIGKETREQCLSKLGRLPDFAVACVGGGSIEAAQRALGELDRAMPRLHDAIPEDPVCRRAFLDWMRIDISLDPLRALPDFQRLMMTLAREFPDQPSKARSLLQSA